MIIGVSGKNCAGKDTIANYLVSKGFEYLSLSDAIRDELKNRNLEITRENLIKTGTEIRQNFGSEELAKRISAKVQPEKNYVIISIRNPKEVLELRKLEGFFMVDITADEKVRFERTKARARAGDSQTLEQFLAAERAEAGSANTAAQQLDEVAKMADAHVENNADLSSLQKEIDIILKKRGFENAG